MNISRCTTTVMVLDGEISRCVDTIQGVYVVPHFVYGFFYYRPDIRNIISAALYRGGWRSGIRFDVCE